jgi:hypothetical protein
MYRQLNPPKQIILVFTIYIGCFTRYFLGILSAFSFRLRNSYEYHPVGYLYAMKIEVSSCGCLAGRQNFGNLNLTEKSPGEGPGLAFCK